ncbi:MAG: HAD-IA family hydrolase [Acutalibacteraceae bacterium]|nr:HAD-IA family hydrolase [Acutalibacteraceae bacterium]
MCCKTFETILFDLDGTLTDPSVGITNSVAYSLLYYGIKVEDKRTLECFIGPPLFASFEKFYGFSKEKAIEAVEKYREYFRDKGIFENRLYDGTVELLKELKEKGKKIVLATSKPEIFALRILEYFHLYEYFDIVVGSTLDGSLINKEDIIRVALSKLSGADRGKCIMIGDRSHDIIGARRNGIKSIGVLYGFGSREELSAQKPDYLAENFEEIKKIII